MKWFKIIIIVAIIVIGFTSMGYCKPPVTKTTGNKGLDGTDGVDGINGVDGRGINNSTELQYEGVIISNKKAELSIYYINDFNNDRNTIGIKVKHYWGKS